jgi:N-acylneuraminate cytidylyltransferase
MDIRYDAIDKDVVIAVIPARGGSKGVPKKNLRLLYGHPLIAYSIAACKLSGCIARVIVSTDSEEIAGVARQYCAEVPFLRPAYLAEDTSTDFEFIEHFINWLYVNEHRVPEYIAHIRPTTPLRNVRIVDDAIRAIKSNEEATSLRSAHKASESPYKWFIKRGEYYASIVDGLKNDAANNARQHFPDAFIPDGYVDVLKTKFIIDNEILHGDKIIGFESPVCVEVDTISDFEYLEYLCKIDKPELLDYLQSVRK